MRHLHLHASKRWGGAVSFTRHLHRFWTTGLDLKDGGARNTGKPVFLSVAGLAAQLFMGTTTQQPADPPEGLSVVWGNRCGFAFSRLTQLRWFPSILTHHPIHFFDVIPVETVLAVPHKLVFGDQRSVDVQERHKEQEGAAFVPKSEGVGHKKWVIIANRGVFSTQIWFYISWKIPKWLIVVVYVLTSPLPLTTSSN